MKNIKNKTMTDLNIDIDVKDEAWLHLVPDIQDRVYKIIQAVLTDLLTDKQYIEISIVLSDNDFIQNLNKTYRDKDKPTNVLSFHQTEIDEMDMPTIMLGDIIIASGVIKTEADEQNKAIEDHFAHILVHGCLHLLHYDHMNNEQAEEMEKLEISILQALEIKNPYA